MQQMSNMIDSQMQDSSAEYNAFLQSQKASTMAMLGNIDAFRSELTSTIQSSNELLHKLANHADKELQQKSEKLEQQVATMLRELVSSGSSSIKAILQESFEQSKKMSSMCDDHENSISSSIQQQSSSTEAYALKAVQGLKESSAAYKAIIGSSTDLEDKVSANMKNASAKSESYCSDIKVSTQKLSYHIENSIVAATTRVSSTADKATEVVTKVSDAANEMNDKAASAVTTFSDYLNQHGSALSEELSSHLTMIGNAVSDTIKPEVVGMGDMASAYGEDVSSSVTTHLGSTPKKTLFSALEALAESRDHELIRNEFRTNHGVSTTDASDEMDVQHEAVYPLAVEAEVAIPETTKERTSTSSLSSQSSTGSDNSKKRKGTMSDEENGAKGAVAAVSSENVNPNPKAKIPRSSAMTRKPSIIEPGTLATRSRANSAARNVDA
jgi:hypothetical protein